MNSEGKQEQSGQWQKLENVILELKYARWNLTMVFGMWGDVTYELSEKTMCIAVCLSVSLFLCVCVRAFLCVSLCAVDASNHKNKEEILNRRKRRFYWKHNKGHRLQDSRNKNKQH